MGSGTTGMRGSGKIDTTQASVKKKILENPDERGTVLMVLVRPSPISGQGQIRSLKSDLRFPYERPKALHESLGMWEISTLLDNFVAAPAFITNSGRDCKAMATKAPIRIAGKSWPTSASATTERRPPGRASRTTVANR